MKTRATVVITGAGTVTCQSVIKALRAQTEIDVKIVTVDANGESAGRYFSDAFHEAPLANDPNFADAILDVCRRHNAGLLIPIVDYEFMPLGAVASRFEAIGCLLAMSRPDVIARTNNKLETSWFFQEHGFSTAQTWDGETARSHAGELPYPVFLKPAIDGRSSIGCHTVHDAGELERLLDEVPNAMVQEFIDAPEFTADILANWQSEVLGIAVRERIETKGGVSYKGRTVADPEFESQVIRLVKAMGIRGPANIQAFRRGSEVIFNEINPRFSGALALSLAAGFNSPLMLLKLALGLPVSNTVGQTRVGVTMLRYWNEVFVGPDGRAEYPEYQLTPPNVATEEAA